VIALVAEHPAKVDAVHYVLASMPAAGIGGT